MLGAYNNTVKNPDPEKIVKQIFNNAFTALCHSCCYYTNTVTFLIQSSTNTCQEHVMSDNKL